jgi:hypothetical protein
MRPASRLGLPVLVAALVVGIADPAGAATGLAWDYFPGPIAYNNSGVGTSRDFTAKGWLAADATTLSGPNAHAYLDLIDDNTPSAGDEVPPSSGSSWNYPLTRFNDDSFFVNCSVNFPCSWDSFTANSWQTNARQAAAQAFFFVNTFHDYLAQAPISFTPAKGSFEVQGGDPVQVQVLDGVNTAGGFPDSQHFNFYRMTTGPDGTAPRMELGLLSGYGPDGGDVDSADDASVVFQLYAEGMVDRLVTDGAGAPALTGVQGRAIKQGLGDWYAMDYLVNHGYDADNAEIGDVNPEYYVAGGPGARSQPMDCPVSFTSDPCQNFNGAGSGGYTYADLGSVAGAPEETADGEIWAQTMWELRQRLVAKYGAAAGDARVETYLTRGLEAVAAHPSMIDLRNAVLQAETVATAAGGPFAGSDDDDVLWQTFANRGMGYFAASLGSDDLHPVPDFSQPPAPAAPKGTVSGTVTLFDGGGAAAGVQVRLAGHTDLVATTAANGSYTIANVPQGTYPYVLASAPGYDGDQTPSLAVGATATRNLTVRRNWAMKDGGATVSSFSAPDLTGSGCGPAGAIDGALATGWGSTSPNTSVGPLGPKSITVKLPDVVDVSSIAVDPGATCGDDDTASVAGYQIETSPDGTTFRTSNSGTFSATNNHKLNLLAPAAGAGLGVRYVRFTMTSTQGSTGDGKDWMDLSELKVFGVGRGITDPGPDTNPPPGPGQGAASLSLSKIKKKVKVSRKGTFVLKVSGAPSAMGTVVVKAKGLGKVKAKFTSKADGTAKVKLKLKANKLAKLGRAGPINATISVELGGATAEKKVKLVAG